MVFRAEGQPAGIAQNRIGHEASDDWAGHSPMEIVGPPETVISRITRETRRALSPSNYYRGSLPMAKSSRPFLAVLLALVVISPESFAFNSPLSEEAIREAYFLGQR